MTTQATPRVRKLHHTPDGIRYHIGDLRRAVDAAPDVVVRIGDGNWIISRWCAAMAAWVESPCHPTETEHDAMRDALGLPKY